MRILFFLISFIISLSAFGKDKLIDEGVDIFHKRGIETAWKFWAKDTAKENSAELSTSAQQLAVLMNNYGDYQNHEYVNEKTLSSKNKLIYIVINMERGPVFGRLLLHKNKKEKWIVPTFNFHTQPEKVWPSSVYTDTEVVVTHKEQPRAD